MHRVVSRVDWRRRRPVTMTDWASRAHCGGETGSIAIVWRVHAGSPARQGICQTRNCALTASTSASLTPATSSAERRAENGKASVDAATRSVTGKSPG